MTNPSAPNPSNDTICPNCPLCGGPSAGIVIRFPRRVIHRCGRCTNGWTHPAPESVPDYETEHFGHDHVPSAKDQPRMRFETLPKQWQRLVLIQEENIVAGLPDNGRWIDIGCGDGMLLERMKSRGYQGVGVEPSAGASRLAREAGLDVHKGYFPHPDVHGPFGVVHMSQTLEHIPDFAATLRSIIEVAPGGRLVLTQTNYTGFVPRTLKERWYAWCEDHHYFHFTPKGLASVLENHGFKIENMQQVSMVHTSRRYRYILGLLDRIKWLSDQFVLRARIPDRPAV